MRSVILKWCGPMWASSLQSAKGICHRATSFASAKTLRSASSTLIRPYDGQGKCAVQTNVHVSHRRLNNSRHDSSACGEL